MSIKVTIAETPELLLEWDYERNIEITPNMVGTYSKKKVWWKCKEGHSWKTAAVNRKKSGCPVCSGRTAMPGVNDLVTLCPEIAKDWDYKKNIGIRPKEMRPGSNTTVWWRCSLGHGWKTSPKNRNNGTGCPYCANKKVMVGYNDLKTLFPEIAESWDYEKNESLTPEMVMPYSGKKVWWKCEKNHSWRSYISNRTLHKRGCPYCAGQRTIPGENDLATLNPELCLEWDYERNGELRPENMMPGSDKKVWWKCAKGHSWKAFVYARKYSGCPVCAGRMVIPGVNDIKTIMPKLADEWDYEKNGDYRPENITPQSNKYFWWRCNMGHSWKAKTSDRYRGNGCPKCSGRVKMRTYYM